MRENWQHGAGHEPQFVRTLRSSRQKEQGVGAVTPVRIAMMFDRPDVRVSKPVAQLGKVQTLLKIVECGLFIRTKCRKKLNPKLHSICLRRLRARQLSIAGCPTRCRRS